MTTENYLPFEFVDNVEDKKHIMLLYDENDYKVAIQNRFIINGLQKGEHCVCFTSGDPKQFEEELTSSGVDLEPFAKQGLVHIHKIEDISHKEIHSALQNVLKQITVGVKPYFRCVGRFIDNISDEKGIKTQIEAEKTIQSIFDSLGCGYISTYGISEIEPENRNKWLANLLKYHHYVIYATEPNKAVAFETDLVKSREI
jgi:hypothetical protein